MGTLGSSQCLNKCPLSSERSPGCDQPGPRLRVYAIDAHSARPGLLGATGSSEGPSLCGAQCQKGWPDTSVREDGIRMILGLFMACQAGFIVDFPRISKNTGCSRPHVPCLHQFNQRYKQWTLFVAF
ncbi:hypothetical protein NDU88_008470 [Pleurodeles waltl]|uniref:Uncharacterized protein n=1 Tax=Pleurodeles waltl TaxID=8319 RepID=A0AAV7NY20_PLEWA|nr:hypothetical protein NDU88_008470 [Pleurodeles waltl]